MKSLNMGSSAVNHQGILSVSGVGLELNFPSVELAYYLIGGTV